MKRYTSVSDSSENMSRMKDSDTVSVASSHRRFSARKRINSELSEPLTNNADAADPYFVFRSGLQNNLELVDEFLAEYLRIIDEIVRTCIH